MLTSAPTKGGALDLINGIIEALLLSPFEAQYQSSYLCEQGGLTDDAAQEVYDEFQATADDQKRTFFDGTPTVVIVDTKELGIAMCGDEGQMK